MKFRVLIVCAEPTCGNELEAWVEGWRTPGESGCGCCPGPKTNLWEIEEDQVELTNGWARTWGRGEPPRNRWGNYCPEHA